MKYRNKETNEVVEAIHVGYSINSIKESLEFIGEEVPKDNPLSNIAFALRCGILSVRGIKIEPCKIANINDYIVKYNDGSFHVIKDEEFNRYYRVMNNVSGITVEANLNTDEYTKLIEEGKKTAAKMQNIIDRLKNPDIETKSRDNFSINATVKPGKASPRKNNSSSTGYVPGTALLVGAMPIGEEGQELVLKDTMWMYLRSELLKEKAEKLQKELNSALDNSLDYYNEAIKKNSAEYKKDYDKCIKIKSLINRGIENFLKITPEELTEITGVKYADIGSFVSNIILNGKARF